MIRIFRPAIFLMNRLHYTTKFMVLGLISLITIIEVLIGLSIYLTPLIDNSDRELKGLELIKPLSQTIQLIQEHRGITSGTLGGSQEMKELRTLKAAEVVASLEFLEKQLPADLVAKSNWKVVESTWQDIQKNSMSWTLDQSFVTHTQLIEQLQLLKVQIADQYALTSDPDIDVHYLLDTAIVDLPIVLERLAQIRGLGTGLLAQKKLSESQNHKLRALMVELKSALTSLTISLDKAASLNPDARIRLSGTSRHINLSTDQISSLITSDILSERFEMSPAEFFKLMSREIDHNNQQLHQILFPTAESLIKERIYKAKKEIAISAGITVLLLMLSYYLFISIYYSTINTIKTLATSAKKIAAGDLTERVKLDTDDELSQIGKSFNEMAEGFNALLVTRIEDEERLRAILDSSLDAVIQMDAKGNIIGWSPHAQEIFGWSNEEVLGHPLHDFIIPLRYREKHIRGLKHFLASGEGPVLKSRIEIEGLHRRGHEFPIELAISQVKTDGAIEFSAFIRDISTRKKAEYESRIAAIAFETMEGIIVTDSNANILRVNHAFTNITGYNEEEVIGKNPSILKSGRHDKTFYQEMWETLSQNKFWQGGIWNKRKSGEVFPEQLRITAVTDSQGQIVNYISTFSDITEQKKSEERINELAFFDSLTHLPNRRFMMNRLAQLLNFSMQKGCYGAVLSIDLDEFKRLNDTKGHEIGDLMLLEVTKRLQSAIHTNDTTARIGGDEFVVLLSGLSSEGDQAAFQAETEAERIREELNQPYELLGHVYHGSISIGICLFNSNEFTADELFKRADAAMHMAKESGRNAVRFFNPRIQSALESRVLLESWLRNAIPEQFVLHYQAQVEEDGRILGAETLIRWQHPEKGLISPAMFIPLAEETGLIIPIGDWVLKTACLQIKAWEKDKQLKHIVLAVNVSAKQFHQRDFVKKVLTVLEETGADPEKLKLELTESLLAEDIEDITAKMAVLKARGVSFSLDDFGTGFSSLSYLKRLPLDQLKIDQSFVRNVLTEPNDAAIVRTVIALGQSMGLAVIAEGVENEEQRQFLSIHGCNHFQGYLFSKPVPVDQFELLLRHI